MPEEEKKTVDIDTSGPDVDINLPEEKKEEPKIEVQDETTQDNTKSDDSPEKPSEQLDVQDSKDDKEPEKKEEVKEKQESKTDQLEEYSEGVKKRIAKLTKKWREAERQKEAAIEFARGGQAELSNLKSRLTKLEPSYISEIEHKVTAGLEAAKAKLAAAREANDINAEVEAQRTISQLAVEETRLAALKERQSQAKERTVQTPSLDQTLQNTPPPDPKAQEWAEKNEWFGKDNAMTYSAFDLHDKLVNKQGYDANSPEYYAEIDRQMRLDFPQKFANTESQESTKPTRIVASATRSVKPGRNTVRLTSSEVAIAKKLGVPLEEYAKQKQITKEA